MTLDVLAIDELLRSTLADFRLSRGEKRILQDVARQCSSSEVQLALFRSRVFAIASEKLSDPASLEAMRWLEEAVKALQAGDPQTKVNKVPEDELLFSPGDDCPRRIAGLLRAAEKTLDICVFTITDDRISEEILAAHRRQVRVRIITDNDKANDPGSDVDRLQRAGISVRRDESEYHMHHKFAIFDQSRALSGSYNWTRGAAQYNAENLLITHRPQLVALYAAQFERLWASFG